MTKQKRWRERTSWQQRKSFINGTWMQAMNYPRWGADDKRMAAYGGYAGVVVVELLCLAALSIAVRGRSAASRTGEPQILCTVGVVLSLFAAGLWVVCGVAWHSQAWQFIR